MLDEIYRTFPDNLKLQHSYSLLDLDFFDTSHFRYDCPDAKIRFEREDCYFSTFPAHEKLIIREQVDDGQVVNKLYSWTTVTSDYLARHAHGIVYLDAVGLRFYLPAWMSLFLKGEENELGLFTDFMLSFLLILMQTEGVNNKKSVANLLTIEQKKVVAEFLSYLYSKSSVEYEDAFNCLEAGWKGYLT